MLTLVKIVQTSNGCPDQWDAWTDSGTKVYMRYRHGRGRVNLHGAHGPELAAFGGQYDSGIELWEFLARAAPAIVLAPGAEVVPLNADGAAP